MTVLINPYRFNESGGEESSSYLDSVLASTCCDIDAVIGYTSGQTLANLIESPAVGTQTAYDFWLGLDGDVDGDEPTFDTNKFTFDGADHFAMKDIAGTILAKSHRTDQAGFWIAMAFRSPTTPAGVDVFFGVDTAGGDREVGIQFFMTSAETLSAQVSNGSTTVVPISGVGNITGNTDYLLVFSWDGTSTTNNFRWAQNTTSFTTVSTTLGTSTTDATFEPFIGAKNEGGAANSPLDNGWEFLHFSCGNAFLDNDDLTALVSHLETRHSKDYTP